MALTHVSLLPVVCWALMFSLITTIEALNTTHFKLFHAVASNATGSPLSSSVDAILASTSDVVVITTPLATTTTTPQNNNTNAQELLKTYSMIGANRILYKSDDWSVVREANMNGTVWTRLKSSALAFMCIIVDTTTANASDAVLYNLVERMDSFCGPQDNMILGFTSAVSDTLSSYLQAQTKADDKVVPRAMAETSALVRQRLGDGTSAVLTTAQKRLYVHAADVACLEAASTASTPDSVGVMMSFCMGPECTPCQQQGVPFERNTNQTTLAPSQPARTSTGKQGLVVLLSCGTFLVGCGLVFYILFHKQFFLPDGNGKHEKEVATNLAYVLRV